MSSGMLLKTNSEDGFTLLETLIALVILGISLSILVEAYLIVSDSMEYQQDYNYVLNWSENKITEIIHGVELARHGSFEYSGNLFEWSVEENHNIDQAENTGLKETKLIVQWQGSNGRKTYSVSQTILDI